MKKTIYLFMMMFTMATLFSSCRETKSTEDKIEETGEEIEDGIDEIGDEIEDATDGN